MTALTWSRAKRNPIAEEACRLLDHLANARIMANSDIEIECLWLWELAALQHWRAAIMPQPELVTFEEIEEANDNACLDGVK